MDIRGLGYIGIGVDDVEVWRSYGELLGVMVSDDGNGISWRIDERPHRVLVGKGDHGLAFAGWELPDADALGVAVSELTHAGHAVAIASEEDCRRRRVRALARTTDPAGCPIELFHGPILDHRPFVSSAGASGFVTGPMGMGHIVLATPHVAECLDFYVRVLGFRVSDFWRPDGDDVVFLRCNGRHHSLALAPAPQRALHHFMLEAASLDDVGTALDRHLDRGHPISSGIGRHPNDEMVSFYSRSPGGFDVELGYGGRIVDEATWTVTEITRPSSWGHHPVP